MDVNNEFIEENGIADLRLVVEDHKIPVSKSVLCIASPVFRAMLEGDFQEKRMTDIPLPGKTYEDFLEFLRCIYPDKTKRVNESTVYKLLPLAQEYDVRNMVTQCQKVLMQKVRNKYKNDVKQLYRHIKLSETYNLEDLKEMCIYLASEYTLEEFKAAKAKYQISNRSHYKIIELALRRHELDKEDERSLKVEIAERNPYSTSKVIQYDLIGRINTESENVGENLKALRLTERFKIYNHEIDVRSELLDMLKHLPDRSEFTEEFDLLPEEIKSVL